MRIIDLGDKTPRMRRIQIDEKEGFVLHPEFVLGTTIEAVKIPDNLVGRLGRSSLDGSLIVHATADF